MRLLKLGENDHILLRTCHHIASDGWSVGVFNREFGTLVRGVSGEASEPAGAVAGAVCGLRACGSAGWLDREALDRGLDYWKEQLSGIPEQLRLPTDRPRPAYHTFAAEVCSLTLPAERWRG